METRTRKSQNMSLTCIFCSMTYTNNPRNQANRPLQLCEKILKSCKEYMDEDDLGDSFMKLNSKRKPLPFCSRCFVTTEKLSELNDKLEEIRAEIMDLVASFKLEFLKSREVMSIYNSRTTITKGNRNTQEEEEDLTPVIVKEEMIIDESRDSERSEPEPLENINDTGDNLVENTENWADLLTLDVQESIIKTSKRRSDIDFSGSELNSDNDRDEPGRKWDSSESSDDKSTSAAKSPKKKFVKKKSSANRSSISYDLYIKRGYELKAEIAENFIYKGHVVGNDHLVLTCKLCQQDKRGAKNDLCNFKRHLRIKHNSEEVLEGITPAKKKRRWSGSGNALKQRPFKMLEKIADHFEYKGHIGDTKNFVMTCKYCGQDKKGQDTHNFTRHLKTMHSNKYGQVIPVTTID